jgi:hypothetical protein
VQELPGGSVSGEQAIGRPGASVATIPVRREVLLVREDRMGGEKARGSHSFRLLSVYVLIVRAPDVFGKNAVIFSCRFEAEYGSIVRVPITSDHSDPASRVAIVAYPRRSPRADAKAALKSLPIDAR